MNNAITHKRLMDTYEDQLTDPTKFTALVMSNGLSDDDMFYYMVTKNWKGYFVINIPNEDPMYFSQRRIFMITDTHIHELRAPKGSHRILIERTKKLREIDEEHGGLKIAQIIESTDIKQYKREEE